jgi:hypothetical protein
MYVAVRRYDGVSEPQKVARLGSDRWYRFMRFSEELHDVAQFPSESRKDGVLGV